MLILKPLSIDWSAASASILAATFITHASSSAHELAHMLDSLVRVSRRVEENHFVIPGAGCPSLTRQSHPRVQPWAFTHAVASSHVHGVLPERALHMTHKARATAHGTINTCSHACAVETSNTLVRNNLAIWYWFHSLPIQQIQILLTFFSKSFSPFPHGTCLLSVSNPCSA